MKYLSLFCVLISVMFFAAPVTAIEFSADSGVQFNWWDSDDDRKATQINIPLTIEGKEGKYSVSLLAGFARTSIELADGTDESLSTILDTKLNLSYEVPGNMPIDILVGLDFNIPTGKTDLSQDELIIVGEMDPDLISITSFGQGFNVNPSVNLVKKWKDWVAGCGVGYLYRGEYDFSENTTDYNPGDIINASAEARYYSLSSWDARIFGYYVHYFKDKQDGTEIAQEGDSFMLGFGVNYDKVEWVAGATVSAVFRDKISKLRESAGGPSDIGLGNELIGDLYYSRELDSATTLKTTFQSIYIGENDEVLGSGEFVGSRKKFSLGVGASRSFDGSLTGEINLKGFILKDDETDFPESRGKTDYKGLVASITASKAF